MPDWLTVAAAIVGGLLIVALVLGVAIRFPGQPRRKGMRAPHAENQDRHGVQHPNDGGS